MTQQGSQLRQISFRGTGLTQDLHYLPAWLIQDIRQKYIMQPVVVSLFLLIPASLEAGEKVPFMLKSERTVFVVESDAATVNAFESESGRLVWTRNLAKEWKDDWQHPLHGLKECSILTMEFAVGQFSGYLKIELNDGKIGFIRIENGVLKAPIND